MRNCVKQYAIGLLLIQGLLILGQQAAVGEERELVASIDQPIPRMPPGASVSTVSPGDSASSSTAILLPFAEHARVFKTELDQQLFAELTVKLANTAKQYDQWGLVRTLVNYGDVSDIDVESIAKLDWGSCDPQLTLQDRILRHGDRYRTERVLPEDRRLRCTFDGTLARIRSTFGLVNGPKEMVLGAFEEPFEFSCPHVALCSSSFGPSIEWMFDSGLMDSAFRSGFVIGPIEVQQCDVDGHPCSRVDWRTVMKRDGQIVRCSVSFAQDRGMIPICKEFATQVTGTLWEKRLAKTNTFQTDQGGRWFPKQADLTVNFRNDYQVTRASYELDDQFHQASVYSDQSAILQVHQNPPPALVKPYTPPEILTTTPQRVFQSDDYLGIVGTSVITYGGASLLIMILVCVWFVWRTKMGASIRKFCATHRTFFGTLGIVVTATFGMLCTLPPGWMSFGVTFMVTGVFGLLWIVFQMILFHDARITIRTMLCGAAAVAVMFAGYNVGVKRMLARQKMIEDVRTTGGQVVVGLWHLDEEGLFLPTALANQFGEAWTGRASRAAIEQTAFSRKNVRTWCLEELRWLGVASDENEDYDVDPAALGEMEGDSLLWTFHADNGYVGDEAMQELSRFHGLVDLHFDCQRRPVSSYLSELKCLERIWLTDVIVDENLFRKLAELPRLESVFLITPEFNTQGIDCSDCRIKSVEVQHGSIDQQAISMLGQLPTYLTFVDCKFNLSAVSQPIDLQQTQSLQVFSSMIDDRALVNFGKAPKLNWFHLGATDVTVEGIESYSRMHPSIPITLE
ncbi:hypothetical protein ACMFWY_10980 [Roseiconus sp. JC912]